MMIDHHPHPPVHHVHVQVLLHGVHVKLHLGKWSRQTTVDCKVVTLASKGGIILCAASVQMVTWEL